MKTLALNPGSSEEYQRRDKIHTEEKITKSEKIGWKLQAFKYSFFPFENPWI
jgi:hypothetical protein